MSEEASLPRLRLMGAVAAAAALLVDQAVKLWLLFGYGIETNGGFRIAPFLDVVLAWNTGISYGWLQGDGDIWQAALVLIKIAAIVFLVAWLWRGATSWIVAVGLGLIIGGALGNTADRLFHGAVVDFLLLHAQIGGRTYTWYVFNLADVAIVAGVIGLLYDSLWGGSAKKAP